MTISVFAYTRVSTTKQGKTASLPEQRSAIERYAEVHGLTIERWFEERRTAAKTGRAAFTEMLRLLKKGKASGVVLHKLDRGARNLRDWSDLGELVDQGIDIHFANENLDMRTRGGRLSADIQAVVAADYIRNLREETLKGFYGRLKQGLLPLPAPLGYLDQGKGKPKTIDPVRGPLIRDAFELYATGSFTLKTLADALYTRGLRGKKGRRVSVNGLSIVLNNPFYIGLMRIKSRGEMFEGIHQPLISKALFDEVQRILRGRDNTKAQKHSFIFRRLLNCEACGLRLIGERQKGHVYYRCHTAGCITKCLREELLEHALVGELRKVQFSGAEAQYLKERIQYLQTSWRDREEERSRALSAQIGQIEQRLERLTDALVDGVLEKDVFQDRRETLLFEKRELEEQIGSQDQRRAAREDTLQEILELALCLSFSFESANQAEKRELAKTLTSNSTVLGKNVNFSIVNPFALLAKSEDSTYGDPQRSEDRTNRLDTLAQDLFEWAACPQPCVPSAIIDKLKSLLRSSKHPNASAKATRRRGM